MRHFCNVGSKNRLNETTSKLVFKSLFFALVSFLAVLTTSTQPVNAASSPSYKYYSSGTEIGAIGGQFGDKTVVLNQQSTGSYIYTGLTQANIKYGWFGSVNCLAGIKIIVNSKNTTTGDISMPPELNYAPTGKAFISPESVHIPACTKDDISHLTDFNKKNIKIGGSFSSTAQVVNPAESDATRQILVIVYSNKPVNQLPSGIKATITPLGTNPGGTQNASKSLTFGKDFAESHVYFTGIDPLKYKVCITPTSIFTFDQCQTVSKVLGTTLSVTFGSIDTAYYIDGKAVNITVNITMSKNSIQGSYGPEAITINSLTSLVDTSTGTSIATINTDVHVISGSDDATTPIALKAKFDNIQNGFYKVCIINSQFCSSNFEKKINTLADAQINVPADQSDQFLIAQTPKTCGDDVPSLGWILCPVISALTGLNDAMWGLVSSLLNVNPLNQSDPIYNAWGVIRNLANIVFVIIFLIMIFSQLSSVGISNYGVKKLLPRLLIGAIMVNLSFIIVQISVDLANIIGSGLYNLLSGLAKNAKGQIIPTWGSLVALITQGGVGIGLAVGGIALAGGVAAAFWMLLPLAAMGALGLLAAVLTLIFRQAVIPVLAILAPLAFVAYLLPNTESWFKKWRDLLMTMLILYPLAALVFGGAQFAAVIMIGKGDDWWKLLIGLIMLTMPLFSLPFLASKSGALVSKVGGALTGLANKAKAPINKTTSGYADRARIQAENRALNSKNKFNPRKSLLERRARIEAIGQNQQRELARSQTEYIAKQVSSDNNFAKQMVRGGSEEALNRAKASAVALVDKAEDEQVSNAITLYKSEKGPEQRPESTANDYIAAVKSGQTTRALALQNILRTSGAPGINALHSSIEQLEGDGVLSRNVELRRSLKSDILSAGLKGKDAGLNAWSYSSGTEAVTRNGITTNIEKSLANLSHGEFVGKTFNSLTDAELSGQSADALQKAVDGGFVITSQLANSLLTNPTTSANLGRSGTREIFERYIIPSVQPQATPTPSGLLDQYGNPLPPSQNNGNNP